MPSVETKSWYHGRFIHRETIEYFSGEAERRWIIGQRTAQRRITILKTWYVVAPEWIDWNVDVTFGFGRYTVQFSFGTGYFEDDPLGPSE